MAFDDLVRVKLEDGTLVSVGRDFAETHDLEILTNDDGSEMSGQANGRTLEAEIPVEVLADDLSDMTGAEVDAALKEAGLPKTGTVSERQQRLAQYRAEQGAAGVPSDGTSVGTGA